MKRLAAVYEDVVGFNIAVGNAHSMQVFQSAEKLASHSLDVELGQVSMFVDHASKVTSRNKLHDNVQIVMPVNVLDVLDNIGLCLLVKSLLWGEVELTC